MARGGAWSCCLLEVGESRGWDRILFINALSSGDVAGLEGPVGERRRRLAGGTMPYSCGLAMSEAIRFLLGPAPSLWALCRTLLIVCRSCKGKTAENYVNSTTISVFSAVCVGGGRTLLGLFWKVYSYFLVAARGDMAPAEKRGWKSVTRRDEHRRTVPANSPLWGDTNIF